MLAAAADPDRDFDAVVVGEYERAFHGDQFREVVARLNALGIEVWLPEAGGPVELGSPVHEALMVLLGAQAREVARARQRVVGAVDVRRTADRSLARHRCGASLSLSNRSDRTLHHRPT